MRLLNLLPLLFLLSTNAYCRVDTLRGVDAIGDATLYGYRNCDAELSNEDCLRYNSGGCLRLRVGSIDLDDHRSVMRFPGWDRSLPDSAALLLYCTEEADPINRRIFIYPLTRPFFEGNELRLLLGDYPSPDSGVTWNHAWLDVGDEDSLSWTTPGGDFTTAVACTLTVTNTGSYLRVGAFRRIIAWWDSTDHDPGIILINENAFPSNSALKYFASSEEVPSRQPMLLLYYPDEPGEWNRRRLKSLIGLGK